MSRRDWDAAISNAVHAGTCIVDALTVKRLGKRSAGESHDDVVHLLGMLDEMSVKGQGIPAYDPRGIKGMGLGYATSNRGACHLRAYTPSAEILNIPKPYDRLAWEEKARLTIWFQDMYATLDSLDVCKFSSFAWGPDDYAAILGGVTGWDVTGDDVMTIGERIYNLERHYNNLCGFDGKDDTLPARFLKEPGTGGSKGSVCELDKMLYEYYVGRGWQNGVVPGSKLKQLGIVA